MPTDCDCPCHADEMAAVALVKKMLDAAEGAGVDLWNLECHRRRLALDMDEYDAVIDEFGVSANRAGELTMSIESEMNVLAAGFARLRSIVEEAPRHRR